MHTTSDLRLVDPAGFEPGLVADLRDERRALLFDLGELGRLAPRVLLRVSHAFVTHTHMDHFAGFDHLLALILGRRDRLVVWGGPGFAEQLEHKLRAYTWNVVHRYAQPLVVDAWSLEIDGSRRGARFRSATRFAREPLTAPAAEPDAPLLDEPLVAVRAALVDHEMPVLAFAIDEKARLRVAADRLAAMGLAPGAWLRELKDAVLAGAADATPIEVTRREAGGLRVETTTVGALRPLVLDRVPGRRIGYVTDLRFTETNVAALDALLHGADLLHVEAVFLDADRDHAARKNHLTALQAGRIAARLAVRRVVPFHFSPRYRGREAEIAAEVERGRRAVGG